MSFFLSALFDKIKITKNGTGGKRNREKTKEKILLMSHWDRIRTEWKIYLLAFLFLF